MAKLTKVVLDERIIFLFRVHFEPEVHAHPNQLYRILRLVRILCKPST